MKFLEAYKDYIGNGSYNYVSEIDSDWVLKRPFKVDGGGGEHDMYDNKDVLAKFRDDYDIMFTHPKIFPKVKLLSKDRMAVERVDIYKAKLELEYIYKMLAHKIKDKKWSRDNNFKLFLINLYDDYYRTNYIELLNTDDDICQKWYRFLRELQKIKIPNLDLYARNIGIDKNNNIKLVDF